PTSARDLSRDQGEGTVALAAPLDPVGMDEDHMGDPAPLPHEPRAWPQGDRLYGFGRAAALRIGIGVLQLPCGGQGKAAVRPLLKLVSDPSGQEVAGEPHWRRRPMKPTPRSAQLEDGQLREPHGRLCDIDRRIVHVSERAAFRCDSGERRRWAWMMSAGNRASFSPCPPGTHSMIMLFTDFGLHGPYTGQMKAVLHHMAPGIPTVDLFADAPVGNPKASAYLLAAYAGWFPEGTAFLCVIA